MGLLDNGNEQRHFVLMAGAGLDALIVYNIDAKLKASLGKVAYWVGGFSQLGRSLPEFEVTTGGSTVRCSFALASRVKNYGGDLLIARNASLFSDQFEVVLFQGAHTFPYMKYLLGVITGRLADMRGVKIIQTSSLEIHDAQGSRDLRSDRWGTSGPIARPALDDTRLADATGSGEVPAQVPAWII